ncbi:hypothetical protein A3SI_08646 [Nitritalea halalkaliphila LW7]|uniref:Uncharacterized protein n=1 Tax=Nitritalea halalkaliphila LW7 TaxID=1189621 RepID=I5C4M0_9BACT|nr:hypothetical protein [Nitritalea halalkaliphila]EIM76772.1 hypothetical protein A3SI_08646 [Nitritalea halalkaliphila LW7]
MKFKSIAALLFGCLISWSSWAQQQEFEGDYVFNGVKGTAKFNFLEGKEGEIIKDGPFRFRRNVADSLDKTRFYKTTITGAYRENLKAGDWFYRDLRHQVTIKDIEEFTVDTELSSEEIRLRAAYEKGLPSGKWNFVRNTYKDGKLSPKASVEELNFTKGMIEGSFQYKEFAGRRTYFVRGGLLPGGIMNGEWTFVYAVDDVLISEVRNYDKGFLLGLVKRNLETDEVVYEQVFF